MNGTNISFEVEAESGARDGQCVALIQEVHTGGRQGLQEDIAGADQACCRT